MTFNEAVNLKAKFSETYDLAEGKIGKVFIVPNNENDLLQYAIDFRLNNFDDYSSKLYSKNSEYKVCALWTDGVNIINKVLK
jgi:hypothetical protein